MSKNVTHFKRYGGIEVRFKPLETSLRMARVGYGFSLNKLKPGNKAYGIMAPYNPEMVLIHFDLKLCYTTP